MGWDGMGWLPFAGIYGDNRSTKDSKNGSINTSLTCPGLWSVGVGMDAVVRDHLIPAALRETYTLKIGVLVACTRWGCARPILVRL